MTSESLSTHTPQITPEQVGQLSSAIVAEVEQVIVGKRGAIELVLAG